MNKFKSQNLNMPGIGNPLNSVRDDKSPHWHVSYNPSVADYGTVTTALVLGQGEYFIVLSGNHKKEFNEIMDKGFEPDDPRSTLAKCLEYARAHKDALHKFSDPLI